MKKIFYLITVLALGLTACDKNGIQTAGEGADDAPVYRFSLPASFDAATGTKAIEIGETAITNSFSTDDKVYVYIQRADGTIAVAHDGINAATYLVPAEIDGTKCTLDGELRFYCDDDGRFAPFEPAVDDVVYMFYNMNNPAEESPLRMELAYFDYTFQNGSNDTDVMGVIDSFGVDDDDDVELEPFVKSRGAAKHDFAMAKMKVTGVIGDGTYGYSLSMVQYEDETKSDVRFENLAAMIRQRLLFKDKDGETMDELPDIEALTISFEGGDYLVGYVWPMNPNGAYYVSPRRIINEPVISAEGEFYLALPIYEDNCNLPFVLEAQDSKGNIYSATKAAPEGGFKNGKYYYGSATLNWRYNRHNETGDLDMAGELPVGA